MSLHGSGQGQFPATRLRRNRRHAWSRNLVREHKLTTHDLILPLFITDQATHDIASMPGVKRWSLHDLPHHIAEAASLGIPAVMLFPVVDNDSKTPRGDEALNPDNLVCRAIKVMKSHYAQNPSLPTIGIITDIALDPYTSHGHDGVLINDDVANDETVALLCKQAVIQAQAGCDMVAPSDMMDGRVQAIRHALDDAGFSDMPILSYAAKYASHYYGPFRDAIGSSTQLVGGGKHSYQMDPANSDEALREIGQDIAEGADMIMVKPGIAYLDIIARASDCYSTPILAYQVSGEYAMIKAAAEKGWLDYRTVLYENLLAFKRAGACAIVTYGAMDIAKWLNSSPPSS